MSISDSWTVSGNRVSVLVLPAISIGPSLVEIGRTVRIGIRESARLFCELTVHVANYCEILVDGAATFSFVRTTRSKLLRMTIWKNRIFAATV